MGHLRDRGVLCIVVWPYTDEAAGELWNVVNLDVYHSIAVLYLSNDGRVEWYCQCRVCMAMCVYSDDSGE